VSKIAIKIAIPNDENLAKKAVFGEIPKLAQFFVMITIFCDFCQFSAKKLALL
jgi:hypothetical protein